MLFIDITNGSRDPPRNFEQGLRTNTGATGQPIAALLTDFKQRDMLKDTLSAC